MKIGYKKTPTNLLLDNNTSKDNNIIISENLDLNLYNDITSIENWYNYNLMVCTDWLQVRSRIITEINNKGGWSNLSNLEKDICIELYARGANVTTTQDSINKVMYLMGKGYSQSNAIYKLQDSYASFHVKEIDSCTSRANSKLVYHVVAKYLNIADASDFIKTTANLYMLYKTQGIRGINDGEAGEGLFDFIESTVNSSYETTGLEQQGYTLLTGTINDFKNDLMDILRNGNY